MTFTSRTYRIAIRRSIQAEQIKAGWITETEDQQIKALWAKAALEQINHTARLQRRKRRERK